MDEQILREKVIRILKEQGFKIGSKLNFKEENKEIYKQVQLKAKLEQISNQKDFILKNNVSTVKKYCRNGTDINPKEISLEIREVLPKTTEEILFKWWNLVWWSIPYQHPVGRQMRLLLWDKTHDAPFGLIYLQSPILKMEARDKYLKLSKEDLDFWVNKSMNAQRVGALPPYNELIGGKMVALSLTCNELREMYRGKYSPYETLLMKRKISPDLLFITTTSAFGRSSMYNRLKYKEENVAIKIGYTKGSGTFHIPDDLYLELLDYLSEKCVDTSRGMGHGPSRKVKLIGLAFRYLGLPKFEYHGIRREIYLFPLVRNLMGVIHNSEEPEWIDRPFENLVNYWKMRWAIPRSERKGDWKGFDCERFLEETLKILET